MHEKAIPKNLPPRPDRSRRSLPDNAIAMIAMTGRATPPMRKPIMAKLKCEPEFAPIIGGKIRFPAPKNIENSVSDVAISKPVPCERLLCVVVVDSVTILLQTL